MLAAGLESERSLIAGRTRAGITAKRRGVKLGRKRKLTAQQIDHTRKPIGWKKPAGRVADNRFTLGSAHCSRRRRTTVLKENG
jgi:DNA invertase Pin-like site-specific DNA recombinase